MVPNESGSSANPTSLIHPLNVPFFDPAKVKGGNFDLNRPESNERLIIFGSTSLVSADNFDSDPSLNSSAKTVVNT